MSTWQITKMTSKWGHAWSPPKATDNTAIVVFDGQACLGLLGPNTSLSRMGCGSGRYRFHFVPLSMRTIDVSTHVSAQETGLKFQVYVEAHYRVADAVTIAIADPPNLDAQVKAKVRGLLHEYDGKYAVKTWSSLQDAIRQHLYRTSSNWDVKVENLVVKVKADQLLTKKRREFFDNTEELELEDSRQKLKMLKKANERQLLAEELEFYAGMLNKGRFHQLALFIADNNEKTAQIVKALETERDERTKGLWALFNKWLDSDDAPLIADRVNDMLQGITVATSLLGGNNNPVLPPPQPSPSASNVLIEPSDDEELSEWIDRMREEQMDESDEDDRSAKKKRDPEDDFL